MNRLVCATEFEQLYADIFHDTGEKFVFVNVKVVRKELEYTFYQWHRKT